MVIRLGIIGLSASDEAWTSGTHAVPLLQEPLSSKYKITAISTSSKETALASAKRWGIPPEKAYTSAEQIAADPDVDMVVVGVKLPMHRDLTLPALNAGKDVFVEWPLATNLQQVKELQEAATKSGVRTVIGLQARASPAILKAKEIIDSGKLGKIVATTVNGWDNFLLYLPPRHDYEHDKTTRANISNITSGHVLDALCFLLGEFKSVNATMATNFPEITTPNHSGPVARDAPDAFLVHGTLLSGAVVSFSMVLTTPDSPSSFTWTITGSKGALKFEGLNINIQMLSPKLYLYAGGPSKSGTAGWEEVPVEESKYYGQVDHLYSVMANGEKVPGTIVDFDGAALRHSMLEACLESAIDGTRKNYL
ncbi:putative NAD binding Rossmann fold oxidoreductase [Rhizodiscina lignyota]|uniref:NAD binding Rossmann fold oxidoreductase n=1 Tax=Rhizodiscina lignyota TaxID=1504668 RepID=A0A9P4IFB4_9PEZI|nr:putative NAD binding Rossmann fold oxidoreductase [Rhizodiscina lignyota]